MLEMTLTLIQIITEKVEADQRVQRERKVEQSQREATVLSPKSQRKMQKVVKREERQRVKDQTALKV